MAGLGSGVVVGHRRRGRRVWAASDPRAAAIDQRLVRNVFRALGLPAHGVAPGTIRGRHGARPDPGGCSRFHHASGKDGRTGAPVSLQPLAETRRAERKSGTPAFDRRCRGLGLMVAAYPGVNAGAMFESRYATSASPASSRLSANFGTRLICQMVAAGLPFRAWSGHHV
jgi:hypothetical protein